MVEIASRERLKKSPVTIHLPEDSLLFVPEIFILQSKRTMKEKKNRKLHLRRSKMKWN